MEIQEADERLKIAKIEDYVGNVGINIVFYDPVCDFYRDQNENSLVSSEKIVKMFDLEEAFQFLEDCVWEGKYEGSVYADGNS